METIKALILAKAEKDEISSILTCEISNGVSHIFLHPTNKPRQRKKRKKPKTQIGRTKSQFVGSFSPKHG